MQKYIALLISGLALLIGCSKDPATSPVNDEHPPATTVILTLIRIDSDGKKLDTTICTVRDTSVIEGKPSVEGELSLKSGSTYLGSFIALDESQTPAKDITNEIIAEKDAHLFKFAVKENGNPSSAVVISELDKDSKGLDFGLNFKAVTTDIAKPVKGAIHIILEHHDDGNKSGTQYDSDLNRDFPFTII